MFRGTVTVNPDRGATANTITINKGTVIKFEDGASLNVPDGGFKVLGELNDEVTFTSLKDDSVGGDTNGDSTDTQPAPGIWGGVDLDDDDDRGDQLVQVSYANFRFGGGSGRNGMVGIRDTFGTYTFDHCRRLSAVVAGVLLGRYFPCPGHWSPLLAYAEGAILSHFRLGVNVGLGPRAASS